MVKAIILFIVGLVLLIIGGDKFVDGAVGIAHKFHLPEILIGATIVSIGTTLPEVMVSATSALKGSGGIAYGNAIGSVICNTSLIAALTVAIKPGNVDKKSLRLPTIFFFGSAIVYMLIAYIFGYFSRIAGAIFVLIFGVYMVISVLSIKKLPKLPEKQTESNEGKKENIVKLIIFIILGAAAIAVGSDLLVDNGIYIARSVGISESVIALTFVALGTSLPELVTAITSLIKGHGSLSLGNIIGANLFDLILVSGIAPLLSPFKVPAENTLFGINASFIIDLPVMMVVMLILCIPSVIRGKMSRFQGISLLLIYAGFLVLQFMI